MMVFKDREEAANKLSVMLKKEPSLKKNASVVVSLLRGGAVLGSVLAKNLKTSHLPLVVTKISAPFEPELALGALCFDITYLEKNFVDYLRLDKPSLRKQIKEAEHKFVQYCNRFGLNEKKYEELKGKVVILTDDGVATGASVRAALLFVLSKKPKAVFLAVPVASAELDLKGFSKLFILHRPKYLGAVSQFYKDFPQIEDSQVKKLIQ